MREPGLNLLISKTGNKYSLVLATAKRAREIIDGDEPLVKITIDNPITIATNEIAQDLVHCVFESKDDDSVMTADEMELGVAN